MTKLRRLHRRPQGRCIFCGGTGLSKEHIFPDWLQELFPRSPTDSHTYGTFEWQNIPREPVPTQALKQKQGQMGAKKVRVVCRRACNEGWLSVLETRCKPMLRDLVIGCSRALTLADQRLLATWITKTTMTGEYIDPKGIIIPQSERTAFHQSPGPLDHWSVWCGFYTGTKWQKGLVFHHSIGLYDPPLQPTGTMNTQYTLLAIGHFFAISASARDHRRLWLHPSFDPALRRLWPAQSQDLSWPPQFSIDDNGAQQLAGTLGRVVGASLPVLQSAAQ